MFFGLFCKLSQVPVLCIQGKMHLYDSYDSPGMELLIVWSNRPDGKIGKPDHNHPAFGLLPLSATEGKTHSKRQSVQRGRDNTDSNIVCSIQLHASKKNREKIEKEEWNQIEDNCVGQVCIFCKCKLKNAQFLLHKLHGCTGFSIILQDDEFFRYFIYEFFRTQFF